MSIKKQEYEKPTIEVVVFEVEESIAVSSAPSAAESEWIWGSN